MTAQSTTIFGAARTIARSLAVRPGLQAVHSGSVRAMSFVLLDHPRPHVALITLNRPERMNAMAFDVMVPLRDALEEVSLDNDTRVVVLTGAGHGFCSGADVEDAGTIPNIA